MQRPVSQSVLLAREAERRQEEFQVEGTIQWYNYDNGYGFALPDEEYGLKKNIFIHADCLKSSRFRVLATGSRVTLLVSQKPKGLCATAIMDVDQSRVSKEILDRIKILVNRKERNFEGNWSEWQVATLKFMHIERGFGFVTLPDGKEAMVHKEVLRAKNAWPLPNGMSESFKVRWTQGKKGRVVVDVDINK